MTWSLSTAVRTSRGQVVIDALDAGPAAAILTLYDGTRPATGGPATTALVAITLNDSCGAMNGADLELDVVPVPEGVGLAAGTATWGRLTDSTGAFVADGDVGSDILVDNAVIAVGQVVRLTSGTLTEGGA